MPKKTDLIIDLSHIDHEDKELVGEKAATLGEMKRHGIPFPDGFVVTPNSYQVFLKHVEQEKLNKEIFRAYKRLEGPLKNAPVEIFLSFPPKTNQQFFHNKETVKGDAVLLQKIKLIFATFFTSSNNSHKNPSIVIQKIPQSSLSGTISTTDPTDKMKIVIREGKSGNSYDLSKKNFKTISKKLIKGKKQLLTDKKLHELAALGKKIQTHYYFSQNVNFVIEGNKIYVTNIKPITTLANDVSNSSTIKLRHDILLKGKPLYSGIATGHLRIVQNMQDFNKILRGEIIVIPYQDLIKHSFVKVGGIVAIEDRFRHVPHPTLGPFFSGKPAIMTKPDETSVLKNGAVVTLNGKNGEVYSGSKWLH